jgi:DEAD/DEAH box helicase domain-containing protein
VSLQGVPGQNNIQRLLSIWEKEPSIADNIVYWHLGVSSNPLPNDIPASIDQRLRKALKDQGIETLYSHQDASLSSVQSGENVVVITGTSSGKTLCYNLPVLNDMLRYPDACALYLFPTKALTQDQQKKLLSINASIAAQDPNFQIPVGIYDGDTPQSHRKPIREEVRILLTNPDMLHTAILPYHLSWDRFFQSLRYIVIDEIHIYRGIFGSHVANVMRRLKRIAAYYGAKPQFILTSATIANPGQLAERLIEEPVTVIDKDGSPQGQRNFLLYNPPIIHKNLGLRKSAMVESIRLAGDLLTYHIQALLFARSRRLVELSLKNLQFYYPDFSEHVFSYRSGYLPRERRQIEKDLRDGDARLVVATNALELGIDIGGIEGIIMIGYPGTIAALRQQSGRSGRSGKDSLALLVASPNPMDQFLMKHPDYLFDKSPEHALVNPDNLLILINHLRCAVYELPFKKGEGFGTISADFVERLLDWLKKEGLIIETSESYHWIADQYPARQVSLRTAGGNAYLLKADEDGVSRTIGEVDEASAYWMVHPDAVYLHSGQSYIVRRMDQEQRIISLEPFNDDYYTIAHQQTTIDPVSVRYQTKIKGAEKFFGEIRVTSQVTGFRKLQWLTNEVLGYQELDMPATVLNTTALWLALDAVMVDQLKDAGLWTNMPNDYGPNWPVQRQRTLERDRYTCQTCGAINSPLHVHHKTPFRSFESYLQANRLDNLITLCSSCHRRAETAVRIRSGLAGVNYVFHHMAPLLLMCDMGDIGVFAEPQSALSGNQPCIAIYDQVPDGIGLSEGLYDMVDELIDNSINLIQHCECTDGCPSCIGAPGENAIGSKKETLALLTLLSNK